MHRTFICDMRMMIKKIILQTKRRKPCYKDAMGLSQIDKDLSS